jgi:hypothetical protein
MQFMVGASELSGAGFDVWIMVFTGGLIHGRERAWPQRVHRQSGVSNSDLDWADGIHAVGEEGACVGGG